jgi:NodT family efflux transporter outer membrane factor (OMF) lipoprotein
MFRTPGVAASAAFAASAALLLAGCAWPGPAAPTAPAERPAPERWQSEADSGTLASWALLADPELQALLQRAEAANRDLVQAALRIEQARTQAGLGALRLTPSAGLNLGANRALDPPSPLPASTSRSYGTNLGVAYELDLWGRLAALRNADAAQLRAAETDLRAARLLLRQRVAESYWQLGAAREQGALAQQQLQLNRELLAATRLRVQEGKLLPIEIDRAAATLQQAEVRLADLQADGAQQRLQLALLLDEAPPGPQLLQPRLPGTMPGTVPNTELGTAPGTLPTPWRIGADPATVLERRPDVQRARAQVDAALARTQAAEAQRYPGLSFSASLGTGGSAVRDWLSNPVAALAGNLVVPLIDWRRLDLQRDAARTELELAALNLRETVARALVEIETALIDGQRLQQQLAANATRLREAQAAENVAALRLEVGAIARADFLQAKNARLEAEQGRLQLQLRAWLNRGQLARALALT